MDLSIFALTDLVAIVTGAGRGIGKGIALGLAKAGANVVAAARTLSEIEAVVGEIDGIGRKGLAIPTDVSRSDQIDHMIDKTMEAFGRIDILVNNAAGVFYSPSEKISENGWNTIMQACLTSAFLCSKAAGLRMIERRKGNIINISSIAGTDCLPGSAPYAAAKAGMINLTRTLAMEWGPYGIRVNCIAPGTVDTPGTHQVLQDPKRRQAMIRRIPLGRIAQPEDMAGTAVYLASEASSYVTGETIMLTGGMPSAVEGPPGVEASVI
ncbi:SDR family NAD(P)-dependent oxidoreductase [Thermodesulfobacteriota bacterium]